MLGPWGEPAPALSLPPAAISCRLIARVAWHLLMQRTSAASSSSLLRLIGAQQPNEEVFPPAEGHHLPPSHTEVAGPKATNKFWANWAVSEGVHLPVFPMPYALQWGKGVVPELFVSHGWPVHMYGNKDDIGTQRIVLYRTPFVGEFALSTVEGAYREGHVIVKEDLFGVHVEVRGPPHSQRKVTFPVYSGMAYVSGRYQGGFTPRVTSQRSILRITKVRPGIWTFRNNANVDFRVYVLDAKGEFVSADYNFDRFGRLSRPLNGWLRLALMSRWRDAAVLDAHARAVLVGWDLEVEAGGVVRYVFEKKGLREVPILHWAYRHHIKLFAAAAKGKSQSVAAGLARIRATTKGLMSGVVGDSWILRVDLSEVEKLGFVPDGHPPEELQEFLKSVADGTLEYFKGNWQVSMLRGNYYFSGKGFQKMGMVCLLLEQFYGREHERTQECAGLMAKAFKCFFDRPNAGDCNGVPLGSYYDRDWGGVPSKQGYRDVSCRGDADFGNACYNDHHFHFGYYVVSAAVLAKLQPEYRNDTKFVEYVSTLIRDTANPSREDTYFPLFRNFDWFDLHSWSRGVVPSADGKDQESTSEDLNLLFGMHLWGRVMENIEMQKLGQTMLALCVASIREFFLMERSNPHHHPDFVRNRVTGIFFQNQVHYRTWFGDKAEYIHGIQMLPLSPALLLTRRPSFCREEWDDIISGLPLSNSDTWTSIILTGNLAIIEPDRAYEKLLQIDPGRFDDGLTKAWALYWAAVLKSAAECGSAPPARYLDIQECGHDSTACTSNEAWTSFFSPNCTAGGLGCKALGFTCCRYCGFGDYTGTACPSPRPCSTGPPVDVPTSSAAPGAAASTVARILAASLALRSTSSPRPGATSIVPSMAKERASAASNQLMASSSTRAATTTTASADMAMPRAAADPGSHLLSEHLPSALAGRAHTLNSAQTLYAAEIMGSIFATVLAAGFCIFITCRGTRRRPRATKGPAGAVAGAAGPAGPASKPDGEVHSTTGMSTSLAEARRNRPHGAGRADL